MLAIEAGVPTDDGEAVAALIAAAEFAFQTVDGDSTLHIDGRNVGTDIRTPRMSEGASVTSAQPAVRAALLELQRTLGRRTDCVVEGRDIGTVVFPEAEAKFFMHASVDERIRRRVAQYEAQGKSVSEDELRKEVVDRDRRDSSRDVAPLKPADDAVDLDTTGLTFDEVVEAIVTRVEGIRGG